MTGIKGTGHFIQTGTSGQKTSFQYSLLPKTLMAIKVRKAKRKVIVILPVTLAPPGKKGIKPIKFVTKIKKNIVKRKGE